MRVIFIVSSPAQPQSLLTSRFSISRRRNFQESQFCNNTHKKNSQLMLEHKILIFKAKFLNCSAQRNFMVNKC